MGNACEVFGSGTPRHGIKQAMGTSGCRRGCPGPGMEMPGDGTEFNWRTPTKKSISVNIRVEELSAV
jgi:hypothetical protein